MKDYIEERVIEIACYIIETGATVRETAKVFKVSKSTVHKDVSERLPKVNQTLWAGVKKVLDQNKAERHIRGGRATKIKYQLENEDTSHEENTE
ncbi:MAG TPA: sporulation transcriptional regulator SpoIIID [Clostridia bacterium]|nr:sporulation transcriptional regulator SpoIIID [Clostridia bacterium]